MLQTQIRKGKTSDRVTELQSESLINSILSMSFGCIAYLRGFFDDDHFEDEMFQADLTNRLNDSNEKPGKNSYIKLKALKRGKSREADLFLDWLEKSCFESIKLKYLDKICLCILLDETKPNEIHESYVFEIKYNDKSIHLNTLGLNWDIDEKTSMTNIRKSIQHLMRQFIVITQTLPLLPGKSYLSMRLLFNDKTPMDFQPNEFYDCTNSKTEFGFKIPKNDKIDFISCGQVETKFHEFQSQIMSMPIFNTETTIGFKFVDPLFYLTGSNKDVVDSDDGNNDNSNNSNSEEFSQITKTLGNIVQPNNENSMIENTQKLTLTHTDNTNFATNFDRAPTNLCECGTYSDLHYSSTIECTKCHNLKHKICYGIFPLSPTRPLIKCISCYDSNLLSDTKLLKVKLLMNIRKLLKVFTSFLLPDRVTMEDLASILGYNNPDSEVYESITIAINILTEEKLLIIHEHPFQKGLQKEYSTNASFLNTPPNSTAAATNEGKINLLKGSYWINFNVNTKAKIRDSNNNDCHDKWVGITYMPQIQFKQILSTYNADRKVIKRRKEHYIDLSFEKIDDLPDLIENDNHNAILSSSRESTFNGKSNRQDESNVLVFDSNFSQFRNFNDGIMEDDEINIFSGLKKRKVSQSKEVIDTFFP